MLQLWQRYELVNSWIASSDLKASFLSIASAALLAINLDLLDERNSGELNLLSIISLSINIVILTKSLMINIPLLSRGGKGSLLYFKDIAGYTNKEFADKINKQNKESFREDLINQIYENSKIATKKMEQLGSIRKYIYVQITLLIILFVLHAI